MISADQSTPPNGAAPHGLDFGMTDIEERLRGPDGAAVQAELLAKFDSSSAQLDADIAGGLPPDEFARAKAVLRALAAAREIVVAFPST